MKLVLKPSISIALSIANLLFCCGLIAQEIDNQELERFSNYERCILFNTLNAPRDKTAAAIRGECEILANRIADEGENSAASTESFNAAEIVNEAMEDWANWEWSDAISITEETLPGAITTRDELEDISKNNSFVITPYRPNYLLPIAVASDTELTPFEGPGVDTGSLDSTEMQFQLSLKFPLLDDFLVTDSTLWMGYTIRAFWQAYNEDISRPFRETNHEPEVFWNVPSTLSVMGVRNVSNELVLNHQSNGQSGERSRSWNRVMLASYWEKGNLGVVLKPWYRVPEGIALDDPDENVDIEDYLGNFELLTNYQVSGQSLSLMIRNNLQSNNRGAAELSYSFPLLSKVDGTIKYFNGYGESLVDYNRYTERLSLGIQITDWF